MGEGQVPSLELIAQASIHNDGRCIREIICRLWSDGFSVHNRLNKQLLIEEGRCYPVVTANVCSWGEQRGYS